jgi:hypothetical protein
MIELIIVFLLFTLLREYQHAKEVELLSKALIAKNIYELKDSEPNDKEKPITQIPEEEISDEAFMGAIRKELGRETPQDKFKEKIKKIWPTNSNSTPQK